MRGSVCGALVLVVVAGLSLPVSGQVTRSRTSTLTMGNSAPAARLPYTAEYKTTNVKTLANGSTITQESSEVVALDSEGRRMTATTTVPLLGDQTPRTRVSVIDPVAHTNSNWSVPGEKATVTQMPLPGAPRPSCGTATSGPTTSPTRIPHNIAPNAIRPVTEDLGTETIQGVEARGHRTTMTTPVGTIGNDAPLVRTIETWTASASGLRGLIVRSIVDDPQIGKMTKELSSFTQAEPDAAVFQPPSGYEIVNREAGGCSSSSSTSVEPSMAPIPPPLPPPEQ